MGKRQRSTEDDDQDKSEVDDSTQTIHEEYQYLNLIRDIINKAQFRFDRTETGTFSIFAPPQLRFSLKDDAFPLLTTKHVFFRGIVEELLWFINSDTNAKHLTDKGIKIWEANGSREYLDNLGFTTRKEVTSVLSMDFNGVILALSILIVIPTIPAKVLISSSRSSTRLRTILPIVG